MKRKCSRCRHRWSQTDGLCRRCQNAVIDEQARQAAERPPDRIAPSYAKPGGFGVVSHVPGMVAYSFFGNVIGRR